MSDQAVPDEIPSELPDAHVPDANFPESHIPDWLLLSLVVIAGSAGYTLLAYLLWLWTS